MPLWLFITLIISAAVIGSAIGSFVTLMLFLFMLNKPTHCRQRR